jgi:hypothetical protein
MSAIEASLEKDGNWKLETGNWKIENGKSKFDTRNSKLERRCWPGSADSFCESAACLPAGFWLWAAKSRGVEEQLCVTS